MQITDANRTRFYVLSLSRLKEEGNTHAVFVAECSADRIDDIIVAIHNAGAQPVSLHDRPEGSRLGSYRYIIEVENGKGISESFISQMTEMPEVCFLGSFHVKEVFRQ